MLLAISSDQVYIVSILLWIACHSWNSNKTKVGGEYFTMIGSKLQTKEGMPVM